MIRINVVVIQGKEHEISMLPKEVQETLAKEWNRRGLMAVGYEKKNTA